MCVCECVGDALGAQGSYVGSPSHAGCGSLLLVIITPHLHVLHLRG